ncbi:MAG: type II toxin-antitoxin system VapC family toxin [Kiritimatiellae bacterium]|nr:type II toxin-antitoxin system VapC family toxin [Kiritimatiellia bacterium]
MLRNVHGLPGRHNLLVDLWLERGRPGDAIRFVSQNSGAVVGLPWMAKAEFLRGAVIAGHMHDEVQTFLDVFIVVWPTEETLRRYATLYGELRKTNKQIGPNDLWIAAAALERDLPLLTRNAGEFSRVQGLTLMDYSSPKS